MIVEEFLIVFFVVNISLIILFKFTKVLLDNPSHGRHKNKVNQGIPLTGGSYFLICFLLIFFFENSEIISNIYFVFFVLIFILGILSDSYKNITPSLRLLIQLLIISSSVYFLEININKTSLFFLDYFISNNIINIFFTIFCLLVLLNGSNFCDGINLNVIGYYLFVFIGLLFLNKNSSENINLILIILCLSIFYISNFFNQSFLGDNGVYLISLFSGIYVINFINIQNSLNPLIAINLLWYPAYENLFTIMRRKIMKSKVDAADRNHFHILFKEFLSKRIKKIKNLNSLSGLILNLFNLSGICLSVMYKNNAYILSLIIIINLFFYNFIYLKLKKDFL